jgi:hypothetical protein
MERDKAKFKDNCLFPSTRSLPTRSTQKKTGFPETTESQSKRPCRFPPFRKGGEAVSSFTYRPDAVGNPFRRSGSEDYAIDGTIVANFHGRFNRSLLAGLPCCFSLKNHLDNAVIGCALIEAPRQDLEHLIKTEFFD